MKHSKSAMISAARLAGLHNIAIAGSSRPSPGAKRQRQRVSSCNL